MLYAHRAHGNLPENEPSRPGAMHWLALVSAKTTKIRFQRPAC